MDNCFSCTASVSSSMGSDDGTTSSAAASAEPMTELCCELDRQSLQPSAQNIMEEHFPASRVRKLHAPVNFNRKPTSFNSSHAGLQHRHPVNRRQPNFAHINKIQTLAEDLLSDDHTNSIASGSSTSANTTSPLPLDMLPSYAACMMTSATSFMSSASASEADEPGSSRDQCRRYLHHKVSRDLRCSASRETMGKPNAVLKSIRVRKGFLKKRSQGGSLASSMTLMEPARVELSGDVASRPDQMIDDYSKSELRPMRKYMVLGEISWQRGEET